MTTERQIIFHAHNFQDFYLEQTEKVREKIAYVFDIQLSTLYTIFEDGLGKRISLIIA